MTGKRILQYIADFMGYLAMLMVVVLILVNGYEIFFRFLFKKSNYWIQDITTLLMVWFVFPGMVKVIWEKKDIVIDLIFKGLPLPLHKLLHILVHLIIIIFSSLMCVASFRYLIITKGSTSITAHIPMWLFTGMTLMGFVLILIMYLYDVYILITDKEDFEGLGRRTV
jgi:TRAP-type C4-dicarboxylate transport system permease small subunit